jgi:ketosteroid isomerase-like protein
MSEFLTPEDLLNSQVEEFNKGNTNFLMTLYEKDACFASEPGQVVNDLNSIRRILQSFINMGARLEAKVKRVIHASDLALLTTEWSIAGTKPANKAELILLAEEL